LPEPTIGYISGIGLLPSRNEGDPPSVAEGNRPARIVISKLAYLIWVIHCERVIQEGSNCTSQTEVTRRWFADIEIRLNIDKFATSKRFKKFKLLS
jgi:hypothetical protein